MKKAAFLLFCAFVVVIGVTAQVPNLVIDYQYTVGARDSANFLSYSGPLRLVTVNKDTLDAVTGASKQKSTALFSAYQTDISGKGPFLPVFGACSYTL
ncbi:hypothetical protein AGMMS50293_26550 [Spirochaetia bacterium]|nr:hypothetical protein AGMMS50293_26550 [Spirochaetia bacterium]